MTDHIPAEDLSIGCIKDGYYIGWMGEADSVVVFTPDGNNIATLERHPTSSGWTPTEIPGNTDHTDLNALVLDTEDDIRNWAAAL